MQLLRITRSRDNKEDEIVDIPISRIRVIVADGKRIMDRRYSYQGEKDLSLPGDPFDYRVAGEKLAEEARSNFQN